LYISSHPLADYESDLNKYSTLKFGDLSDTEGEGIDISKLYSVRMCGIITAVKIKQSKKGNRFCVFILEDFTGLGECVVFPQVYEKFREILQNDMIVMVTGRPEENGNAIKLLVDEIKPLIVKSAEPQNGEVIDKITIKIHSSGFEPEKIHGKLNEIKVLASRNGGSSKLFINLDGTMMELPDVKINYDDYAKKMLSDAFGSGNVIVN